VEKLVSIITPAYNVEQYISETIASVINQTYSNWELLITDDASTDNTIQIVEAYLAKDQRIKLFKLKENSGAAVARNLSIKKAKGRFIAFLDADDIWLPNKLSIQVETMLTKAYSVCYSSYTKIDEHGKSRNTTVNAMPQLHYSKLLKNNYIGNLTGIYDALLLGKIYTPDLEKRQDWCLWLKALETSGKPAYGIQQPLAKYRHRKNSISRNKIQLLTYNFQVYHRFLKFNVIKSSFHLLRFLVEYFFVRPKYILKSKSSMVYSSKD